MSYTQTNEDSRYLCSGCYGSFSRRDMSAHANLCKSCKKDADLSSPAHMSMLIINPPKKAYTK